MVEKSRARAPKRAELVESRANGLIWVGDTAEKGTLERLQREFDAIGAIDADFEVRGLRDFTTLSCSWYGYPYVCRLYRSDWGKDNPHVQRDSNMAQIAFDQTVLRERVPVNYHCTANLFMRYVKDEDGIRPDYESSYQYFSVMRYRELERYGLLDDCDATREESVVALVEHRTGMVVPLPQYSVVNWAYFSDGSGVEVGVYEGKSLRWQLERYPEYFGKDFLNEDVVELDILNCVDLLERLESQMISPRSLTEDEIPAYPFHESGAVGRNPDGHSNDEPDTGKSGNNERKES